MLSPFLPELLYISQTIWGIAPEKLNFDYLRLAFFLCIQSPAKVLKTRLSFKNSLLKSERLHEQKGEAHCQDQHWMG